ncbi:hypothetical protein B296_00052236, partial [Ensete ventricosum]
ITITEVLNLMSCTELIGFMVWIRGKREEGRKKQCVWMQKMCSQLRLENSDDCVTQSAEITAAVKNRLICEV